MCPHKFPELSQAHGDSLRLGDRSSLTSFVLQKCRVVLGWVRERRATGAGAQGQLSVRLPESTVFPP